MIKGYVKLILVSALGFSDRVSIMKVRLTFQLLIYITYKDPLSLLIGVAQGVHFV